MKKAALSDGFASEKVANTWIARYRAVRETEKTYPGGMQSRDQPGLTRDIMGLIAEKFKWFG